MLIHLGYGGGGHTAPGQTTKKLGKGAPPNGWPHHIIPWVEFHGATRSKLTVDQVTEMIVFMMRAVNIDPETHIKSPGDKEDAEETEEAIVETANSEEATDDINVIDTTTDDANLENDLLQKAVEDIIEHDEEVQVEIQCDQSGSIVNVQDYRIQDYQVVVLDTPVEHNHGQLTLTRIDVNENIVEENNTPEDNTSEDKTAKDNTAEENTADDSTAKNNTTEDNTAEDNSDKYYGKKRKIGND